MKRNVIIATSATLGVTLSALLAHFLLGSPEALSSKSSTSLLTTHEGNTFTGPSIDVSYGRVRVEITVLDGKITDARAVESPVGRSSRYSQYAIPVLRQQTLAAQSADIQGASGASFTSYGWKTSLQAAMKSAKL
jgi:uncharacterized protein with FMN-binding domain